MAGRCPHLGLVGNRHHVVVVSSPRHRCYLHSEPERIGSAHQAEVCLTSGYRRCRRLRAAATADITTSTAASTAIPVPAAPRYTELHKGRAKQKRARRRWSATELVVAVLAAVEVVMFAVAAALSRRQRRYPEVRQTSAWCALPIRSGSLCR